MEEFKRHKIIYLSVIIALVIIAVGVSYAFFAATVTGNETSSTITLQGGYLGLTFDGGPNISVSNVYPKAEAVAQKDFTVTANNTTDSFAGYQLKLIVDSSTFSDNAISYKLISTNTANNGSVISSITDYQKITSATNTYILGKGFFQGAVTNAVHSYSLYIYFLNTESDQNADQNATFNAHIGMESSSTLIEATETTSYNSGTNPPIISTYDPTSIKDNEMTIYSVGYVTNSNNYVTMSYQIKLNSLPSNIKMIEILDYKKMTTLDDFNAYIKQKNKNTVSLASYATNQNDAVATAAEMLQYTAENIDYSDVSITGANTIQITENLSELTSATYHSTVTKGGSSINAIYVPIKINIALLTEPSGWSSPSNGTLLANIKSSNQLSAPTSKIGIISTLEDGDEASYIDPDPEESFWGTTDDYGTTYYFRGYPHNNYVKFANKCWRIYRVAGNGSIKLLLQNNNSANDTNPCNPSDVTSENDYGYESAGYVVFNSKYDDNAYIGLMYGTAGSSTYAATHANINKSTILTSLENWYTNNLISYANYFADDIWCNNKRGEDNAGYSKLTTHYTYYYAGKIKCYNDNDGGKLSKFTVNDTTNGNGNLTYPIGLLTLEELNYAKVAFLYYPYRDYWLLNPGYYSNGAYGLHFTIHGEGNALTQNLGYDRVDNSFYLRPSIALKSSVTASGTGTKTDPYIITGY